MIKSGIVTHSERQLIESLQRIREILNTRDRNDIENEVFHVASNALCQSSSCDAQFKTVDFDLSLNESEVDMLWRARRERDELQARVVELERLNLRVTKEEKRLRKAMCLILNAAREVEP